MNDKHQKAYHHDLTVTNQSKKQTEEVKRIEAEKSRYEYRKHFKPIDKVYGSGGGGGVIGPGDPEQTQSPHDFEEAVKRALAEIPNHSGLINDDQAYWIQFDTNAEGVSIPDGVRKGYPDDVLVVLQYQFKDLQVDDAQFSVTLWFSGEEAIVEIPYKAMKLLQGPDITLSRKAI